MKKIIGIYTDDAPETLAHLVDTLSDAARWIGCSLQALYKAQHLDGYMHARRYKLELINEPEETKTNLKKQRSKK